MRPGRLNLYKELVNTLSPEVESCQMYLYVLKAEIGPAQAVYTVQSKQMVTTVARLSRMGVFIVWEHS